MSNIRSFFASERNRLLSLYAIGVIYAFIRILGGLTISEDSPSYIDAFDQLLYGQLHTWRTPIYPIIVGVIRSFSGDYFYLNLQIFQYLFFLFGFHFFYKLAKELISNQYILYIISVIYLASPCTIGTCSRLLTEAVTITLFVIFTYLIIQLFTKRVSWVQWVSLITLGPILILLRPSNIYIIVVLFIIFLMLAIKKSKLTFIPLFSLIAILLTYIGYSEIFYQQHGLKSTTVVGVVNMFHVERQNNNFDISIIENKEMKEDFKKIFSEYKGSDHPDYYEECYQMMDKYGVDKVNEVLLKNILCHPFPYIKGLIFRAGEQNTSQGFPILCFRGDLGSFNFIQKIWELSIPFSFTVWIILVYLIFLGIQFSHTHKIPFKSFCLFLLIAGNYTLVLISAMGEWSRLNYNIFPLLLISMGQIFNQLNYSTNKSFIFE